MAPELGILPGPGAEERGTGESGVFVHISKPDDAYSSSCTNGASQYKKQSMLEPALGIFFFFNHTLHIGGEGGPVSPLRGTVRQLLPPPYSQACLEF